MRRVQQELSKNILHAPFPNTVVGNLKILIAIQQSRII
jgi:hypothetical protein